MVKFVHSADWQLGMTRHFLSGEAQPRFDGARLDVVRTIGALAVQEGCEFVVVGGDVFESNQVGRQVVARALDAMAATPQITFYLLPGNHDPLDASSVYWSPAFKENQPDNVVVLESAEPVEVSPGVELVGAPWFSKRPLSDLVGDACADLGPPPTGGVRIVVGHGAVDSLSPDPDNPANIKLGPLERHIAEGRVHYVALGDRHSTTDVGGTGRVWYSGAPEPTDYREDDPGNALVVSLSPDAVDVTSHRVGTWRFVRDERNLTGDADIDSLESWLGDLADKDRTIVKLSLVGQVTLGQMVRLEELLEHHEDLLAALETWERRSDLVVVPDDSDLEDLGLSGFAHDAAAELRELSGQSGDTQQAQDAQAALGLLYRLARGSS